MSKEMLECLVELQPRESSDGEGVLSPERVAENSLNEILDRLGDTEFDIVDLNSALEGDAKGPFQNVFIQECDAINILLLEMRRSLNELNMGFAGELTMTDKMEDLMMALFLNRVPSSWTKLAWASERDLGSWLKYMSLRLEQLMEWTTNPLDIQKVVWISGLGNPTSFLTAIKQVTAQKDKLELDKLVIQTDVSKKMSTDDIEEPARDGAYVNGFFMEGARWDVGAQIIDKSQPKEMFVQMPIINCRAVPADKAESSGIFMCPIQKRNLEGRRMSLVRN